MGCHCLFQCNSDRGKYIKLFGDTLTLSNWETFGYSICLQKETCTVHPSVWSHSPILCVFTTHPLVWPPLVWPLLCVTQFSPSVLSDSLRPHGRQHARLPCPSPIPGAYSNSCPSSRDAIQPSHHLLSPSPPAFNLSQHQGLFQ